MVRLSIAEDVLPIVCDLVAGYRCYTTISRRMSLCPGGVHYRVWVAKRRLGVSSLYQLVLAVYPQSVPAPGRRAEPVSAKTLRMMRGLITGASWQEVATEAGLTQGGASSYIVRAKNRLGAKSLYHLAVMLRDRGLLDSPTTALDAVEEEVEKDAAS